MIENGFKAAARSFLTLNIVFMYIFYVYVTINGSELFKCLFFLLQHLSPTSEIRPKIE